MTYSWRTLPTGAVEVDGRVPELDPASLAVLRSRVMRWRDLAAPEARDFGVPLHWILGMVFAESAGDPSAVSADGGYGLLQLTHPSLFEGHPKADTLKSPALNLHLGTKHLARIVKTLGAKADLPRAASAFNAGMASSGPHPSAASPWGMRETKGHVSRVVSAANSALKELGGASPKAPAPPAAGRSDAETGLAVGMVALKVLRFL